jgi:hypothetical protein
MSFDIEAEKKQFRATAKISNDTYATDDEIGRRTRRIFKTFARALAGRSDLPKNKKEIEIENLIHVVRHEVIHPILSSPAAISSSQAQFDEWHRAAVSKLKTECPISWESGSDLTVGTSQKLINLHCKDVWALDLIPESYSRCFHPIIDTVTLDMLRKKVAWTLLDSYEEYMQLQLELRQMAQRWNTYPLALECRNWNRNRKRASKRVRSNEPDPKPFSPVWASDFASGVLPAAIRPTPRR